jgi:hypothetical protein
MEEPLPLTDKDFGQPSPAKIARERWEKEPPQPSYWQRQIKRRLIRARKR